MELTLPYDTARNLNFVRSQPILMSRLDERTAAPPYASPLSAPIVGFLQEPIRQGYCSYSDSGSG